MVVSGVSSMKQTVSPMRFLWSSPTAGVSSQLEKGREWRDTLYFCWHSSQVSLLTEESHFSMQDLCTSPTDPEQRQGEISLSPPASPSWQILQNTPEEFLLD